MKKFKPGDKIYLARNAGRLAFKMNAPFGARATVSPQGYYKIMGQDYLHVTWDQDYQQMNGGYDDSNFELVVPEKKLPDYVEFVPAVLIAEHTKMKRSGKLTDYVTFTRNIDRDIKGVALRNCHGAIQMPYLTKNQILELTMALADLASYMED